MGKSVEYYISKGFDPKMAEYFSKGRHKIVSVTPNKNFTLTLVFDNDEARIYDVAPLLHENVTLAPLLKEENFRRVYLDDCHSVSWDIDPTIDSNVVWNNKFDLCPDCCYVESVPLEGGAKNA